MDAHDILCQEFNANNINPRDVNTLRRKYDNLKKRTKKKYADEKLYMRRTGGGPPKIINIDSVDQSLKDILGSHITGMESEFDDDRILKAVKNNEINGDDIIENQEEAGSSQEEAGSSKIEVPQKLN
ncbi:unnamed protein product [Psylliodes chrysocephalus]|uniref:Regulatory protein zeste n=1 Tax=Psylliodes chrysocephalus TaxID=3402493 RepID=A0A9P0CJM2_9CUCU|nr:unnamed protein product [Psylliodes chrysocephala]